MRRGTTPTVKFELDGIDVTDIDDIYVTFKQGSTIVTKDDVELDEETNTVAVHLTQADTLAFKTQPVSVQIRIKVAEEALATEIKMVNMEDVLFGGVI